MSETETSPSPSRTNPTWIAPTALLLAVVAAAVAVWSAVRTPTAPEQAATATTSAAPAPASAEQAAKAKTAICGDFTTVRNAVSLQTNGDLGTDPVALSTVAANARLATLGGGQYLLSKLTPAVPTELADAVRSFANGLQDIGMQQLVGASSNDPKQMDRMNAAQSDANRIGDLCK